MLTFQCEAVKLSRWTWRDEVDQLVSELKGSKKKEIGLGSLVSASGACSGKVGEQGLTPIDCDIGDRLRGPTRIVEVTPPRLREDPARRRLDEVFEYHKSVSEIGGLLTTSDNGQTFGKK